MIPVCIRMPPELLTRLKDLAPKLGFRGYQPLIRSYVTRGMAQDDARFERSPVVTPLLESLRRHGIHGTAIADAVADCEGVDGDLLPLRVIHVAPRPPATLTVTLSDGTVNEINLEDQLWGSYEPLKDPALFAQAGVNDQTGLVQWPNGLDLPLDMLLL